MQHRYLGRSGLKVSAIAYGNWITHGSQVDDDTATAAVHEALSGVGEVALFTYALPAKGVGIYAFAETGLDAAALRAMVAEDKADLVQPVARMPRRADGSVREDALHLVATNRLDELELLMAAEPGLEEVLKPIIAGRLNLTDRILKN